jgi:transcriptional regulator with PAS, ATPase and Fis domain
VRIIAATNRDIRTMIQQGLFREDLYYRINVINIKLPPLRERREDIPLLVEHFLRVHSRDNKRSILSSSCMKRLIDYRWPGNVRELENEIERLTVLCDENEKITEEYLSPRIRYEVYAGDNNSAQPSPTLPEAIERLERTMLLDHLKRVRLNKTQAAKTLGISRRNLIRKVQAYELDRRRKNN